MLLGALLAGAGLVSGCEQAGGKGTTTGAPVATATPASTETSCAPATAMAAAMAPRGTAAAAPAETAAPVTPGAKTFDCGARGQKPCPMQRWMKSVMANASSSEDGEQLAKALGYVASHAPPGYGDWTTIANAGVAKAKAGDVDGAKVSCKKCHDAYKENYQATMRDRPF